MQFDFTSIFLTVVFVSMLIRYFYWKGYIYGYGKAKDTYDETCSPEDLQERLKEIHHHFHSTSSKDILKKLKECGLGKIEDPKDMERIK